MGSNAIAGHPQRAIEPHISAANAAGIFAEGSRFGVYIVGPCIGHGGMARIYRAEHEGLRRQVALKVLTDGFAKDGEGRKRFLREARIAAAIKHPNVVNIFDVGVQDGIPYLVMELLEGEDLESLLHTKGAIDESSIIDVIVPVVAGLAAVHDAGVVHRDLKPGNIFLAAGRNDETEPKLLDFGISKASGKGHMKLTSATKGLLMGTPFYMSPEAIQGADMTSLSDQYSLGVLLYECATGTNPFSADTFAETVRRITTGEYPPLSAHPTRLSRRLVRIIERSMAVAPQDRYPDLRALGRDLLMLAGQRTRITWSLSFGEVVAPKRSESATIVVGQEQASAALAVPVSQTAPPAAIPTSETRKSGTLAALLLGGIAFATAAFLLWPGIGEPPPMPVERIVYLKPTIDVESPASRPVTVPNDSIEAAGEKANSQTAEEAPPVEKAKAETKRIARRRVVRAKPKRSKRTRTKARRKTTPRPRSAVAKVEQPKEVVGSRKSPANTTPDWAQGLRAKEVQGGQDTVSGTNNAPIFD